MRTALARGAALALVLASAPAPAADRTDDALAAAADAAKATADLRGNHLELAQQRQQQVLDILLKALAKQRTEPAPEDPRARLERRLGEIEKIEQHQKDVLSGAEKATPEGKPSEVNPLQVQQRQIANELRAGQPEERRAGDPAEAAEKRLAELQPGPATEEMRRTLAELGRAKEALKGELARLEAGSAGDAAQSRHVLRESAPDLKPGDGQTTAKVAESWRLRLDAADRETLTISGTGKFPPRYEQALSDYFSDLAAGERSP